jgi:putative aminopeptidase FrvX
LAEDASGSGMTGAVSVFVQKSGTLRVTRLGCMHIILLQITAQFWKLFESSMCIDVLVQNWKTDVKLGIKIGRTVTVNVTFMSLTK